MVFKPFLPPVSPTVFFAAVIEMRRAQKLWLDAPTEFTVQNRRRIERAVDELLKQYSASGIEDAPPVDPDVFATEDR